MLTRNGRPLKLTLARLAILLAVLASSFHPQPVAASSDVLDGIALAGDYTDADTRYLRQNLETLREELPLWSQYIEDAKPLTLVMDLIEGAHGRAAVAKCCVLGNRGVITFGAHFGTLTDSDDAADQTPDARRIRFLVTLVHEVTHVRDQRAGKFVTKTDFKSCVDAEKSAFAQQINFEDDLLTVTDGGVKPWLALQVESEIAALKTKGMWQQYCGTFD